MYVAKNWKDYEVIDTGGGEKLERWGDVILRRPDPQIIWPLEQETNEWRQVHGHYHRGSSGGGNWDMKKPIPERWTIGYENLKFHIKPTSFKHTGLFPEQAANWSWMMDKISNAGRPISVLNLFAYTGGATVAAAMQAHLLCMWMRLKAWFNGPRKMFNYPDWLIALFVLLQMMYSNLYNGNNVAEIVTTPLLWTLLHMAVALMERHGNWKRTYILS